MWPRNSGPTFVANFTSRKSDENRPLGGTVRYGQRHRLIELQTAGQYFVPWHQESEEEPLSTSVNYDRTKLVQDDIVTATATLRNNLPKTANMVMVDLGIPPGFDLLSEDLQEYRGQIHKHEKRAPGKIQSDGDTGNSILQFAPGRREGASEVSASREVSDSGANVPIACV